MAPGLSAKSSSGRKPPILEVTRRFCYGNTEMQAAFGVRYAQLGQSTDLIVHQYLNATDYCSGSALDSQGFHGAGLTGTLSGVRPLGCLGSNFNLFWSGRASILWDNSASDSVETLADFERTGFPWPNRNVTSSTTANNASLFIGEIEIGGQWDIPLRCIPASAFIRLAFEYQYWSTHGFGVAASLAEADGASLTFADVNGDSHVNLLGFTIGTGITW